MILGRAPSFHRAGPRRWAATVEGAAAAAAGLIFAVGAITVLRTVAQRDVFAAARLSFLDLAPAVAAVVAVGVAWVSQQLRFRSGARAGWAYASAGALVATTVAIAVGGATVTRAGQVAGALALAVAGGLALGGASLACAEAFGRVRLALVVGLISGVTVGPLAAAAVLDQAGLHPADGSAGTVILCGLALAATGLAAVRDRAASPVLPVRRRVWPIVLVAALAAAVVAANLVQRRASLMLLGGPDAVSQRRVDTAVAVGRAAPYAIAVGLALVLVWYAARRGGAAPARWVLTCLGLGLAVPAGLPVDLLARRTTGLVVVVAGAAAALAGVVLARRWGRLAPWDALGLAGAAAGMLLFGRALRVDLHGASTVPTLLVIGGLAAALSAGITALLNADDRLAVPDVWRPDIAESVTIGFAAMLLGGWVLGPVAIEPLTYRPETATVPAGPVIMLAVALVSATIFAVSSGLATFRSRLLADADVRTPVSSSMVP
jgi:hypothetical protein